MRYLVALAAAAAVYLTVSLPRGVPISVRVGRYLTPQPAGASRLAKPIEWLQSEAAFGRLVATGVGVLTGLLLSQGDLFIQGPGRSALALGALGGTGGWLVFGMYRSTVAQRRARRLRFELPVVADTIALHVIAGESVASSIERFVEGAHGVAADELAVALGDHAGGSSVSEALQRAGTATVDPEAQRLYVLLAHAHDTGGRLADALGELSTDYRSALSRDLTAEGGRRALATYGPVLALMLPVTLIFLLYPTLAGLRSLAGGP